MHRWSVCTSLLMRSFVAQLVSLELSADEFVMGFTATLPTMVRHLHDLLSAHIPAYGDGRAGAACSFVW